MDDQKQPLRTLSAGYRKSIPDSTEAGRRKTNGRRLPSSVFRQKNTDRTYWLYLALQSGGRNPLDELFLRQEEDNNHRQRDHDRGGEEQLPMKLAIPKLLDELLQAQRQGAQ